MSNLFSGINARLRGPPAKSAAKAAAATTTAPDSTTSSNAPTPLNHATAAAATTTTTGGALKSPSLPTAPKVPPLQPTPSLSQSIGVATSEPGQDTGGAGVVGVAAVPQVLPLWLSPAYAKHIVKGNFMTLSAKPKTVEQGEWIAHQVVEHYRLLWNFVRVVHEKDDNGSSVCNPTTCPRMSAGRNHSYTWLNSRLMPTEIPAYEYMSLMQRWISGKIDDTSIFPTDPAGVSCSREPSLMAGGAAASPFQTADADDWVGKRSGFPKDFHSVCKTIILQMFRVYAHLYWNHFVDPFYHLNLEKQLNSCFSHFILTATALDMLKQDELEPMQLLIDLWAANGTFPPESKAYALANLKSGRSLLQVETKG